MCNPRAPLLALATLLTSLLVLVGGPLAVGAAGQARAVAVDAEGEPILDVVLDGNVLVDHGLIQANLRTRPGSLYARRNVDEDIRWMHDTYGILVEDVPVRMVAGGAVVTFKLRRILQYEFVDFEGNDEFSDRVLRDEARIGEEGGATPDQLVHAKSLITDHYLSKGFPFVQVEVRPSSREDGTRGAVVRVFEGPETETQKVVILGLDGVDEGAVRELLRSERGFWSWLVGKDFVRADVDRDILILEDYVRREGFLDAEASLDGLEWSEDRTEVVIRFLVDQGERYTVRSMSVTGNGAIDEETLLEGAALGVGDPYRRPDVQRVLRHMRDQYGHIGYIDMTVRPQEIYDLEGPVLDLTWVVNEGREKKVRDIIVHGNVGTRDGVVRRYMTVYPGDVIDTRELRYSEDALVSLGYFTDLTGTPKVRVSTQETDDPEYVDVVVTVDDASSGVFTFVLGAGSDSGLFGGVTIDKRNFDISRASSSWSRFLREFFERGEAFHGGGQRLFLEVVPGTETTAIDIVFQDPWLDESQEDPWGLTVELYDRERVFSEYTQNRLGTGVFFDHKLSRETSISIGPRIENVKISDIDDEDKDVVTGERTEFAKAEGTDLRRALEGVISYNDVDSLFEPTDGFTSRLKVEQVGGFLGGEIDAVRAQWSGEWFHPIGEDDDGNVRVLHPRLSLGVVEPLGDDDDLPFYENFFVGGGTGPFAVRGFDFQGVGPHQEIKSSPLGPRLDDSRGNATGGELAMAASLEALFPMVTNYNPFRDREETIVKGVLFMDVGNLLPNSAFGDLGTDLRASTGAGMRLRLPALGGITIKLDWAVVLREEDGDETRPFNFELSRRF